MNKIAASKTQLEDRLAELKSRLDRLGHDLREPVTADFEDQAVEREDDEVQEDLVAAGHQEIRMIEAALHRIEAGTYGTCANCGDPISVQRLYLLPHTPICRDCAAKNG